MGRVVTTASSREKAGGGGEESYSTGIQAIGAGSQHVK